MNFQHCKGHQRSNLWWYYNGGPPLPHLWKSHSYSALLIDTLSDQNQFIYVTHENYILATIIYCKLT